MNETYNIRALTDLGFTQLEARVYACLLVHSPITGYGVAKKIGAPVANTYKAIQSLQLKGAVLVDEGEKNLCRAIPSDELLDQMERRFRESKTLAAEEMKKLGGSPDDDRVYHLTTPQQVYERCRSMLEGADQVAFLDLYPGPFHELKSALSEAADRGVKVAVQVYEDVELDGIRLVNCRFSHMVNKWPRQWLQIVVDGTQFLIALFTEDGKGVHQAIWSASPIISWVFHTLADADISLAQLLPGIESGTDGEKLSQIYKEWQKEYRFPRLSGIDKLIRRFNWE